MKFNYNFGTEATFIDWVADGIQKAEEMLDLANKEENTDNSDENKN